MVTLREYLFGRRIVLCSPHRKDWVIAQIKRAVPSRFGFMNHGISGGVFFGRLRLAWDFPMFSNGFRPVFRGHFVESGRGTELHTVFGAPTFLRAFLVVWYLFLTVFSVMALSDGLSSDGGEMPIAVFAIPLFLALFPIGAHLIFNARADEHYNAIRDMLAREAGLVEAD